MPTTPEQNRRRRDRIDTELNAIKAQNPCACGETDPAALDFHHKDPTDKISRINNLRKCAGLSRIWAEVKKCIVICANCHRKGHAGRPRPEHAQYFTELGRSSTDHES